MAAAQEAAQVTSDSVEMGPPLGTTFALGVIRTAFHCYKRLLKLNWAADEQGDDGAAD